MSKKLSEAQTLLCIHLKELGFEPEHEYRFHPAKRWRADIFLRSHNILIECDGGLWKGGHKRGKALAEDYERNNWAQMAGYRMLRFTNEQVLKGEARTFIKEYL